jgi:hypothetical protein
MAGRKAVSIPQEYSMNEAYDYSEINQGIEEKLTGGRFFLVNDAFENVTVCSFADAF